MVMVRSYTRNHKGKRVQVSNHKRTGRHRAPAKRGELPFSDFKKLLPFLGGLLVAVAMVIEVAFNLLAAVAYLVTVVMVWLLCDKRGRKRALRLVRKVYRKAVLGR